MNTWQQHVEYPKYRYVIMIIFVSLILGSSVSFFPIGTLLSLSMIFIISWLCIQPKRIPLLLLLSTSVSFPIIFSYDLFGFNADTVFKLATILIMLLASKHYGVNWINGLTLVALYMLLIVTYTLSDIHPRMNMVDPMISFFGLLSYFLILIVKWEKKMSNNIVFMIVFLPLISVGIGVVLNVLGIHSFMTEEYFGGRRLQGAHIAAHLAMLTFLGFCVSLIESKRRAHKKLFFLSLAAVNFFLLLSTGTRGPLIACMFIVLVFIADHIKDFLKGKLLVLVPLVVFVISIGLFVLTQWENIMLRTFNGNTGELGMNFSGREVAWQYFMTHAKGAELFGQGLGASLVANDGSLYNGFIVPHNEYIRFYFDNGIIGLLLLFGSLLFVLIKIGVRLQKNIQLYYVSFIVGVLLYAFVDNTFSTIQFIIPFCFYLSALSSLYMNDPFNKHKQRM